LDSKEEKLSSDKEIDVHPHTYSIKTKDVEFTMTFRKIKNPGELLKKFYLLREDQSLSNKEKDEMVKKIMMEYMG